jgi:hypothetical protein
MVYFNYFNINLFICVSKEFFNFISIISKNLPESFCKNHILPCIQPFLNNDLYHSKYGDISSVINIIDTDFLKSILVDPV